MSIRSPLRRRRRVYGGKKRSSGDVFVNVVFCGRVCVVCFACEAEATLVMFLFFKF